MLKISDNRRFLVHAASGKPFFYLGDTAWELFHRLNREEADLYLENRARKGFTVIQAVVLAELNGLTDPNPYGHAPLHDLDARKPNEDYFKHVDYIVNKATSLGMYTGMLPTWGDKVGVGYGHPPNENVINESNAADYGRFLGKRYRDKNIIWILGGDRLAFGVEEIWRTMARGIKDGDGGRNLMTFHPVGQWHSATWFHNDDWLDFNTCQTGHTMFRENYRDIHADYALSPVKPCLDSEPGYEDHPNGWDPGRGYLNDFHSRNFIYWATFAGACGHTYGCHDIWQMFDYGRNGISSVRHTWKEALDLPGSFQMQHAVKLLMSRPYLTRIPDQGLILSNQAWNLGHMQACRDGTPGTSDSTYLMVYFSNHRETTIRTERIASDQLVHWWFNPRTGEATKVGAIRNEGRMKFTPPTNVLEQDWVLVLDAAPNGYGTPGKA
jgi:hypothetical protein